MTGIKLGKDYRVTEDDRIEKDEKAVNARLDVSTRLKRRNSKRTRPVKRRLVDPMGTATDLDELARFKRSTE